MTVKNRRRWNHDIHHHPSILRAIPDGARHALDVGCGVGILAREPRRTVPRVTTIDLDAPSIDQAREHPNDDLSQLRAGGEGQADHPGAGAPRRRHRIID